MTGRKKGYQEQRTDTFCQGCLCAKEKVILFALLVVLFFFSFIFFRDCERCLGYSVPLRLSKVFSSFFPPPPSLFHVNPLVPFSPFSPFFPLFPIQLKFERQELFFLKMKFSCITTLGLFLFLPPPYSWLSFCFCFFFCFFLLSLLFFFPSFLLFLGVFLPFLSFPFLFPLFPS